MSSENHKKAILTDVKSNELKERLNSLLENLMKNKFIKHAIATVEKGDRSFKWIGTAGRANPDGVPMENDTPFWIASVTKLYIAATILKLHEKKSISIDHPLSEYLPENLIKGLLKVKGVDYTGEITLRHLLEHSSGLPDYLEIHPKGEKSLFDKIIEQGDRNWSIEKTIEVIQKVDAPLFAPQPLKAEKKKVRYSDTNYQLLITVIETVTGKSLQTAFQDMIYQPLGLEETFHPGSSPSKPLKAVATVYYKDTPLEIPEAMSSFGDLNSTVNDLLTFMRALVNGEVFDKPATFDLMRSKWNQFGFSLSPVGPGWPIEYGIGIMRFRIPRILSPFHPLPEVIGHTGVAGSWLFYCPKLDFYLAGDVSQITASPLPFRLMPKMLSYLNTYFH